jgi:hypothetical protein
VELLVLSRFDPLPGAPTFHGFNPIAPPIVSYSYPPSSLYERFAKAPSSIPQHAAQSATADAQFSCPRDLHVQAKIVMSTFTALLMELLNRGEGNKNGRRKCEHQSEVEIQPWGLSARSLKRVKAARRGLGLKWKGCRNQPSKPSFSYLSLC